MRVEVILVKTQERKLLDRAVQFFTNTDIRHAAIMFPELAGDVLFEASGQKKGVLAYRKFTDLKDCKLVKASFDIDDDACFKYALEKIGTKYDFRGFLLWFLNRQTKGKLYCFEYIANILKFDSKLASYVKTIKDGSVSGQDILKLVRDIKKAKIQEYEV